MVRGYHALAFGFMICIALLGSCSHDLRASEGHRNQILFVIDGDWAGIYCGQPGIFKQNRFYCYREGGRMLELFSDSIEGRLSRLSPGGNFVSLMRRLGDYSSDDSSRLCLFSFNGEFIRSYHIGASQYWWSPDEKQILFVTTSGYREGKERRVTGVWLLDISNGKVSKMSDCNCAVEWAGFDKGIYLQSESDDVYIVSKEGELVRKASLKGIKFSATGKYHFQPAFAGARIFVSETGDEITDSVKSVIGAALGNSAVNWSTVRWGTNNLLTFHNDSRKKSVVFDLDTHSLVDSFEGVVLGWIGDGSKAMLVMNQCEIVLRKLDTK